MNYTVQTVLTDENIERIATKAMSLIEKEAADNSVLLALEGQLKETEKRIKNLVSALEMGIVNQSTKDRLDELEQEKQDIQTKIIREEMKKPLLTKERIVYWLTSFKSGNIEDIEYQRRVIDTLVNSVFVYDSDDGGRTLVLTFNISGDNTRTLTGSDIERYAPPSGTEKSSF